MASVTQINSKTRHPHQIKKIKRPIGAKSGDRFLVYVVDEENALRFTPGTILVFLKAPYSSEGIHLLLDAEGYGYPAVIKSAPNKRLHMQGFHDDGDSGNYMRKDLNIIGELWEVYPANTNMRFVCWRASWTLMNAVRYIELKQEQKK